MLRLLLIVLIPFPLAAQSTIYVDVASAAPGNGTAQSPFVSIQAGIAAAPNGSLVLVSSGVYLENLTCIKPITVRSTGGPQTTVINGQGLSSTVVLGSLGVSRLEGFRVIGGIGVSGADGASSGGFGAGGNAQPGQGGGIHVVGNASISGCIVANNRGGDGGNGGNGSQNGGAGLGGAGGAGGIEVVQGTVEVSDSRVEQNQGGASGFSGIVPLLSNAVLPARPGVGGLQGRYDTRVERCTFDGNQGGGHYGVGGLAGAAHIVDCNFSWNRGGPPLFSQQASPGLVLGAGAIGQLQIHPSGTSSPVALLISRCTVTNNFGALGVNSAAINISSVFALSTQLPVIIEGCLVADNLGHGIAVREGTVRNCTVTGNQQLGLVQASSIFGGGSTMGIENSIIWGNASGSLSGSLVQAVSSVIEGGTPGTGILNQNPVFIDPANGDYHLALASPCIDQGVNALTTFSPRDWDGEPRIAGGQVDIGADEFTPSLTMTQPGGPGAPVFFSNRFTRNTEHYNVFSFELCAGALGSGPFLGLCASSPLATNFIISQLNTPIGTSLSHFSGGTPTIVWGPISLPPIVVEGICFGWNSGTLAAVSSVRRFLIQ